MKVDEKRLVEIDARAERAFELQPYPAKDTSALSGRLLEFLVHAREDLPALIGDLREARGQTGTAARLERAIRAYTVDSGRGTPTPNGPAEAAWLELSNALLALPDPVGQHVARLAGSFLDAELRRLVELREAAEAFFGGSFRAGEG